MSAKWMAVLPVLLMALARPCEAGDPQPVLKASGITGGICLVIGGDEKLATGLASSSHLYVRLHCKDDKRAFEAGRRVAEGELRGQMTASSHRLAPMPYVSDLLNLIVLSDPTGTRPAELVRVLAPGGVLAVKGPFKTRLTKIGVAAGFKLYRKPAYGPGQDWGGSEGNSALGRSAHESSLTTGGIKQ